MSIGSGDPSNGQVIALTSSMALSLSGHKCVDHISKMSSNVIRFVCMFFPITVHVTNKIVDQYYLIDKYYIRTKTELRCWRKNNEESTTMDHS